MHPLSCSIFCTTQVNENNNGFHMFEFESVGCTVGVWVVLVVGDGFFVPIFPNDVTRSESTWSHMPFCKRCVIQNSSSG